MLSPRRGGRDARLVRYDRADPMFLDGWTIAPEEDGNHVAGYVWLERGGRWPRPIGWGVAALGSAALWLVVAGVVWWALTE